MQEQHHHQQPQHIETISYKTKNNYNSIELHSRSHLYAKKYQQQQQQQQQQGQQNINYPNTISQQFTDSSSYSNHHSQSNSQGAYLYKVENFTSFGTISCSADNSYGSSGPCLYHIMVAGTISFAFTHSSSVCHLTQCVRLPFYTIGLIPSLIFICSLANEKTCERETGESVKLLYILCCSIIM
jgi:hypothetical protein